MDWMTESIFHLHKDNSNKIANKVGQALWDFYMYQIHILKKVHADPHPGNLVNDNNELVALDFGCMKQIPTDFTRLILN
jgi:predicted unusual protein kinase regulating ubiquinone biosynthesis (AarF/ABC1/UbiB family)